MMWPLPDDGWYPSSSHRAHPDSGNDVHLAHQVADALLTDDRTRRLPVTVEVQNGVVLLSGTVHDQRIAELVAAAARQVPGVRDVRNSVRTRVQGAPEADTGALTTSGRRESEVFDEIVAAMSAHEDPSGPPARPSRRLPSRAGVFLVAVILLFLGWLVMALGWLGVLIACALSTVLLEIDSRRRRANRDSSSPQARRSRQR